MTSTPTFQRIAPLLLALALLAGLATTAEARGFRTGFIDPMERAFAETDGPGAYAAARAAGASVIRLPVVWGDVGRTRAADLTDSRDPAYFFAPVDDRVREITANGLEPLLSIYVTPPWARTSGPSPDPGALGGFATALARRYAGDFVRRDGVALPRVRLFQIWNEPNLKDYLDQSGGGAPAHYRAMLQAAYPAIKGVHADNVVVAGGLGPFGGKGNLYGTRPLPFMRAALTPDTPFDAWAMHPYTSGPPARKAATKGDASIGNLPEVRSILRRTGHGDAELWATEFSWDTSPPDPFAVPLREQARWIAEGFYRMWAHGVSTLIWFQLRDNPNGTFEWGQTFQSGLYFETTTRYADEKAKPGLRAFRFPFVALPAGRGIRIWGRTPDSAAGQVVVERRRGSRWRRVTT
ncbi:MAG: glycoside hydrolase family 5 protein, partial [Actinomycetota bacterium]|nr:glycoside hydrolase family 5 protein [Actinomycetota bacterium]